MAPDFPARDFLNGPAPIGRDASPQPPVADDLLGKAEGVRELLDAAELLNCSVECGHGCDLTASVPLMSTHCVKIILDMGNTPCFHAPSPHMGQTGDHEMTAPVTSIMKARRPLAVKQAINERAKRLDADEFRRVFAQAIAARCLRKGKSGAAAVQQAYRSLDGDVA